MTYLAAIAGIGAVVAGLWAAVLRARLRHSEATAARLTEDVTGLRRALVVAQDASVESGKRLELVAEQHRREIAELEAGLSKAPPDVRDRLNRLGGGK